ncbi:hypothetical protein QSJ19_06950 [Gordonia sp. ABSL11-1]|uniref:hypothetical protein n=1 Tax=Gordonia sp. ABSL11-1 TaxID=3053924 RepID=UPI00257336BC|nr:hypothetical protein [Gordonia sp. ABSL11-1]MDL9945335.1 hypothetical protein [Gordonia sp. ABSL11-1]
MATDRSIDPATTTAAARPPSPTIARTPGNALRGGLKGLAETVPGRRRPFGVTERGR